MYIRIDFTAYGFAITCNIIHLLFSLVFPKCYDDLTWRTQFCKMNGNYHLQIAKWTAIDQSVATVSIQQRKDFIWISDG